MEKEKTVFVGLSGGVDSAVAALRLSEAGFNVVGVFIKVWHPAFLDCNWEAERLDAMRVAAALDIPFLTCDAEEAYKKEVAEHFISEYEAGRTPNPDVLCNQAVKFGAFLEFAVRHGASFIATGHYAQRREGAASYELLRGVDAEKDQSYFLWTLTQAQLARTLLPIGEIEKHKTRAIAKAANIPVAAKKDSQGICFLGAIDIPEFLSHYIDLHEGAVLDANGTVIGSHRGSFVYTLGQRHGFSIDTPESRRTPQYVVAKDLARNTITVAPERPLLLTGDRITLARTNWITAVPSAGDELHAQIRYRQSPFRVRIEQVTHTHVTLSPEKATDMPAAGQSCVLYAGKQCLGGGIIA